MNFYVLINPKNGETDAVTDFLMADGFTSGEAPICETCGACIGMRTWEPPHRVEMRFWGRHHGDVAFGPSLEILVSEEFKESFCRSRLTGLQGFFPAEVIKVRPKRMTKGIPSYYVARVQRGSGAIDVKPSELEQEREIVCKR